MHCITCGKEKRESDFLTKNGKCYKCVFDEKVQKFGKPKKEFFCRICHEKISGSRWIYCSSICAEIGDYAQKRAHWTMKIKAV